jgi:itaconate CoA-transferase
MAALLEGTTVVDLTQGVSGPFCTRLLSQFGARVIKIERPGRGDIVRDWDGFVQGMSSGHAWINPGKESVAIDLKSEQGQEILLKLVSRADVLVENFVPGTLASMGLTQERFQRANENLITCHVSGYGQDGPYRDRAALDLIIQGETGVLNTNGSPDQPAKISMAVADLAGAMYSAISILGSLLHRERTGQGQEIDVALFDSLMTWAGYFPYMVWYRNREPGRVGLHHHTMAPYGPYQCSDGKVIVAAGAGARVQWLAFCVAIGRPELVDDPRFSTNEQRLAARGQLDALITRETLQKPVALWVQQFHEAGLPSGALNEFSQGLEHPRMKWRDMVQEVPSSRGPIKVLDMAPQLSGFESVNVLGPPELGEHTVSVLAELGYTADELAALLESGAVQSTPSPTSHEDSVSG